MNFEKLQQHPENAPAYMVMDDEGRAAARADFIASLRPQEANIHVNEFSGVLTYPALVIFEYVDGPTFVSEYVYAFADIRKSALKLRK